MPDPLDFLWKFAYSPDPMYSQAQINGLPASLRDALLADGYLSKAGEIAGSIRVGGELVEVYHVLYPDGNTTFCYNDEYGRPEKVDPEMLTLDKVDFLPLARLLHTGLSCRGEIEEVIAGKLWKVGAAGQQSREVYLARNWGTDVAVQKMIAEVKKGSLIFRIGTRPDDYEPFGEEQIYDLDCLISYSDDTSRFEAQSVFDGLKDMIASRPQKARISAVAAQKEHQVEIEKLLIAWFRFRYENAKRRRNSERQLPNRGQLDVLFNTQKRMAEILGIPEASISRARKTWSEASMGLGYTYVAILNMVLQKQEPDSDAIIDFYNNSAHTKNLKAMGVEY